MNTFLNKILQLTSIREVLLLSPGGELLFCNTKETDKKDDNNSAWKAIIAGLNSPITAEMYFITGTYYLHQTNAGYVIVGMKGHGSLQKIKNACENLQLKLSQPNICRKVLLKMLHEADDALKPELVTMLFPLANEEIAQPLIVLLEKAAEFDSQTREKLFVNSCQVLGQCASVAAKHALKNILQKNSSGRITLGNEEKYAAQVALAQLELDLPEGTNTALHKDTLTDNISEGVLEGSAPRSTPVSLVDQSTEQMPEAQKIRELLHQNRKSEAVALIMEHIAICAGKKQFDLAEKLREWLIKIDFALLKEIIRAAEIIEEAKNASISDELSKVWNKLANALSAEDFSSLYHVMEHRQYDNGELIVEQGEFLSTLFFVNSGRIQLYSASQGGEYVLKVIGAGDIMGAETFFDISIWTMSARSLGADVSLLTWDRLVKLKESHPALQTKLMDFCSQFKLNDIFFNKLSTTRRQFERIKVSGKVAIALLQKMGDEIFLGTKGELLDISRGGLAFSLRFSRKQNAIALLGQGLRVTVRTDVSAVSVHRNGIVKAVQCHDYVGNDYTIHMEFGEELSSAEMSQVIGSKR
jgi:CRP-like cAMP-binding protein